MYQKTPLNGFISTAFSASVTAQSGHELRRIRGQVARNQASRRTAKRRGAMLHGLLEILAGVFTLAVPNATQPRRYQLATRKGRSLDCAGKFRRCLVVLSSFSRGQLSMLCSCSPGHP